MDEKKDMNVSEDAKENVADAVQGKVNEENSNSETESVSAEVKYKSKRLVRKRKTVGKADPVEQAIRLTLESGKVILGYRESIVGMKSKKAKAIIISSNAKGDVLDKVKRAAEENGVPAFVQKWTSIQLGTICGRPYPVSVMCIVDEGTSNLLKLLK